MRLRRFLTLITVVILLASYSQIIFAQDDGDDACIRFEDNTITQISMNCADNGDDSVCYAYPGVDAAFIDDQGELPQPGAKDATTWISMIKGQPFDLAQNQWGISLYKVNAYVREENGQPVFVPLRYLVVGDTELEQRNEPVFDANGELIIDDTHPAPMQDFFLRTGFDIPACDNLPKPGLLVQSPLTATETVEIVVNGVSIQLEPGTTVILRNVDPVSPGSYEADYLRVMVWTGLAIVDGIYVPPAYYLDICLAIFQDVGVDRQANDQEPDPLCVLEVSSTSAEMLAAEDWFFGLQDDILHFGIQEIIQIIRSALGGTEVFYYFLDQGVLVRAEDACAAGLLPPDICTTLGF